MLARAFSRSAARAHGGRRWWRSGPVVISLLVVLSATRADEGQWPPDRLDRLDWQDLARRGLTLAPEAIWNPGEPDLAAAVLRLDGCSASFVGDDGLILTNHHCAYRAIAQHSTGADDRLANGFLASSWADELRATGTRAEVLRRTEDVTATVHAAVPEGADDRQRWLAVQRASKEIVAACERRPATRCRVAAEFGGLRHVLFESMEIRDIRLVWAPPASVGEFGGEVDNWMWPRHTGDFALMRAYVSPSGEPAPPADDNVPYRPARRLRLSRRGVRPGDLVLVLGYPGRTDRYLPAVAVEQRLSFEYPRKLAIYTDWMQILERAAEADDDTRLAVASRVKRLANTIKNLRGMQEGLARLGLLEAKRADEAALRAWLATEEGARTGAGSVLDELDAIHRAGVSTRDKDLLLDLLDRASLTFRFARTIRENARERARPDLDRREGFQERDQDDLRLSFRRAARELSLPADRAVMTYFLARALELPAGQRLEALDRRLREAGGPAALVDGTYDGTRLHDTDTRLGLLAADLADVDAQGDAMLALARLLEPEYDRLRREEETMHGALSRVQPRYARLLQRRRERVYPDANETLRISVATVRGYSPRDAVWMESQTTLSGLLAKETGVRPFASPDRVLAAARSVDPGRWVQPGLDDVPLCFLADADTTGGNSGSPVVNGSGELVGLNFDRVFENIAGDYAYSDAFSRNVSVDVRYLLWMLERVEGAWSVLREMGIEPSAPEPRN